MSMLTEYIKLIPTVIKNRDKIAEGIITDVKLKYGKLSEDKQEEIMRRRAICVGCPFMSKNAKEAGIYASDRPDEHCILCNCNIEYKTSCLSCNCGIEAYNAKNPKVPMKLKWEVYNGKSENTEKSGQEEKTN